MSEAKILEHDPLTDAETILRDDFYGRTQAAPVAKIHDAETVPSKLPSTKASPSTLTTTTKRAKAKSKPTHYKVVCISLYTQDIQNLESMVAELKRRGHTKANKSQLIRQALRMIDLDKLPPPQQ